MKLFPAALRGRSRLLAYLSIVGVASATFLVVATNADGYKATNVDLDDGTVWVTNVAEGKVGRLNIRIDELDFGLAYLNGPDVVQDGRSVLVGDTSGLAMVDVQTGVYTPPKNEIAIANYQIGGGKAALLDPVTGKLWTGRAKTMAAPDYPKKASGQVSPGSALVVTATGRILIVDRSAGVWFEVETDPQGKPVAPVVTESSVPTSELPVDTVPVESAPADGSGDSVPDTAVPIHPAVVNTLEHPVGDDVMVSAVGDELMFLGADGTVFGPSGKIAQIPGDTFAIQAPGPRSDRVLVASNTGLFAVQIGSDSVVQLSDHQGVPAQPVRVGTCAYGAWAAQASSWFKSCPGKPDLNDVTIAGAGPDDHLVFRVNQSNVAINSTGNGGIWAEHDGRLVKVTNWDDVKGEQPKDDSTNAGNAGDQKAEQICAEEQLPPKATDDPHIGVRKDPTIIDVLSNDSDPNCDPIAVASVKADADTPGQVLIVDNGQHVMFAPSTALRDGDVTLPLSFTFTYTVTDSANAESPPATATVSVTDPAVTNSPPELRKNGDGKPRSMRTVVESGETVSYDVLADWWDPDGDGIRLVSATAEVGAGEVTASPSGTVRYGAFGVSSGIERVQIKVSDGQRNSGEATGELEITVLPQGQTIKPVAHDDFVTVFEGATAVVHPLVNDSDGNGDKLNANFAALATPPSGITNTYDSASDTLTVGGVKAGVYGVAYQASDGVDTDTAVIHVVVTAPPGDNVAPIAVPDRVVVRPGRVVNVDVLGNDIDADGDLLALVSASAVPVAPELGGIRASIIDRRIVQIEMVAPTTGGLPTGPFYIDYSIDDGKGTDLVKHVSSGLLTVLVDPSVADQAPIATPDSVIVRTGDVASVPVIVNDVDADGDRIVLNGVKADEAAKFEADGGGVVWTEKQIVRVRGGVPGTYVLHYDAVANGKQVAGELTVTVKDSPSDSSPNQAPKPIDLQLRAARGNTVRVAIPIDGIDPDGDSVHLDSVSATDKAAEGTLVQIDPANPNRLLFSSTPQSAVTSDHFVYTVVDSLGQTNTANVEVVIVNVEPSAPVAHDDVVRARPGRIVLISPLSNDVDADDDKLALADLPFLDVNGIPTLSPLNPKSVGVVADEDGGVITGGRFQVTVPFAGEPLISERYRITDGANTADAYVQVIADVLAPNAAPIAGPDVVTIDEAREKKSVDVDVLKNDFDPDDAGATLRVTLPAVQSMPGVAATTDGSHVIVTLTPLPQVIVYLVTDSDPDSPATSYGIIHVPGVENHAPVLTAFAQDPTNFKIEASPPTTITIRLADVVEDPDLDPGVALTDTEISAAGTGSVARVDATSFTFTPNAATEVYTAQVVFEVEDRPGNETSMKSTLTIFIPVSPGNTAPISLGAGQVNVPQVDEPVTYDLAPLMRDDQKDPLTFVLTTQLPGFAVQQSNSKLTITSTDPAVQVGASFTIFFTATDGLPGHAPVQGSLVVTVTPTNKGRPVAADIGPIEAVVGQPAAGVDVIAQTTNPFPDVPLTIESATASGSGSVGCIAACRQSPIVFTPTQPGTFTVNYVVKDKVGQTATATITYVVKGLPLAPGVPQIGSVGDSTVNLTWSAADMQGGALVKYVITAIESNQTKESTTTAIAFDGLENAKTFHFTVYAVNEVPGNGEVSQQSNGAIPDRVPDAPINPRIADYQDGQLTLKWDAPANAASYSPISGYEVNLAGFGIIPVDGPGTELVKTGLTNGVDYSFTVRAKNAATTNGGWGASSSSSVAERPSRYPDTPTGVTAVTAGDGGTARVKVTWEAPVSDGGRSITSYKVCRVQSGGDCLAGDASRQVTFTAATGSDNSFTVIATNSDKNRSDSDASAASNIVQGIVTPATPSLTGVTSDDHRLTAAATMGSNGGCSTSFLEYALNGGGWQPTGVFAGLVNGTSYTVTARVTLGANCVVPGGVARSSANAADIAQIPYGPLGQPTITSSVSPDPQSITWTWNANQGDNGRAWVAAVTGECTWTVGPGGIQSGTCSINPSYSSGTRTATITISAPNVAPMTATSSNATPPPPPLIVPTMQSSINGTSITWSWNANQSLSGTRLWTAMVSGECSASLAFGGVQTGQCTMPYDFNSGNKTVTITVVAPTLASTSATSTIAIGDPPPLATPIITTSRTGNVITWNWNANQPGTGTSHWTASISGPYCSGSASPAGQTGSCSHDFGYSSGTQTVTITVSAPHVADASNSASNSTPPPPPPPRVIQTAKSATLAAPGTCGGGTTACYEVDVSGQNFTPGATLAVNCEGDQRWFPLGSADGSGNFGSRTSVCYHDTGSAWNQTITVRDASGQASALSAW